ncbi:MAG: molybdenum cofactor guanylyltransferase [Gammaproteobacteria bacterium]|nr:molybdenum cofactor guanylyltransferase [Gammaproteobacteria bacterium]
MGKDKASLERDGRSQLQHAVELLQASLARVFVSTRAEQQDDPLRRQFECIVDRYDDMGPLAGILTAMEHSPESGWLVLACDLPNVDSAVIDYLLDNISESRPFTAYASSYDGLPEPLCAYYAPAACDVIRQFAESGVTCPRKIMIRSDTKLLQQPDPAALDNVNTPEDLRGSRLGAGS